MRLFWYEFVLVDNCCRLLRRSKESAQGRIEADLCEIFDRALGGEVVSAGEQGNIYAGIEVKAGRCALVHRESSLIGRHDEILAVVGQARHQLKSVEQVLKLAGFKRVGLSLDFAVLLSARGGLVHGTAA